MGCRQSNSRAAQEQATARGGEDEDMAFSTGDLVDLQAAIWNVLASGATGDAMHMRRLRALVTDIQNSISDANYSVPRNGELACRLLIDTVEREHGSTDTHFVHNLETEDQVLKLTIEGGLVKPAALEILLQWYVTTSDCATMLQSIGIDESAPCGEGEYAVVTPQDISPSIDDSSDDEPSSLLSFVWKGSPDIVNSHLDTSTALQSPVSNPTTLSSFPSPRGNRETASVGSLRRSRSLLPADSNHNLSEMEFTPCRFVSTILTDAASRPLLEQLGFTLRSAFRAALRTYSTSHYDEVTRRKKSQSQMIAGCEWSRDRIRAIKRCASLDMAQTGLLQPVQSLHPLTVVLDLDETLVFARQGPLWVRPGVTQFLQTLKSMKCEVVCWTASNRSYAGGILARLDPLGGVISQCIYSHPKWMRRRQGGPSVKDLKLIGRDLDYTLIVDNLPDAVLGNEYNAIVVENYEGCELHDTTLATLAKVIEDIILSRSSVPAYLRSRSVGNSHLVLRDRTLHSGAITSCFMLNSEPAKFSLPI